MGIDPMKIKKRIYKRGRRGKSIKKVYRMWKVR
ncbi:Protein of unknown function [Bacillus wiedmannii]|nr:Protein of unknown function [Bacillus wiedmannii]